MKKLLLILIFISSLSADRSDLDNDFFLSPYKTTSNNICEPSCRLVDESSYTTKMIDFDAKSGLTICEVYSKNGLDNESSKQSIMANTLDQDCQIEQDAIQPDFTDSTLSSKKANNYSMYANIDDYQESSTTMSKFIGGLATLDEDVINITDSVNTSTLVKSNPNSIYSPDSADVDDPNLLLSQIDSLNTNNLAYLIDLFYTLDSGYEYLLAYIFVLVGMFFLIIYFSKFAIKKVSKKPTSYDEPFAMRLAIIAISCIFFFVPIKYDNNLSSTLFQNAWKYFVYESTSIADEANKIAMKSFVKYVYNTSGASGVEEEATLKALLQKEEIALKNYENALQTCEDRYPEETTFQITNSEQIAGIEENRGESDGDSVTYIGCQNIEKKNKLSYTQKIQYEFHLARIKSAYENDEIVNRLDKVSTVVNKRADELGWYSSMLIPSIKVLTELSFMSSNETPSLQEEVKSKIRKALTTDKDENRSWLEDLFSSGSQFAETQLGESFAKIIYLIFPGAGDIFELGMKLGTGLSSLVSKIPALGVIAYASTPFVALAMTAYIITLILSTLPLLSGIVASILAIITYLYELIIYTLISPFVVAFSLTTGQGRKIIDFLINGIMLFLKPIIIVLSIYLSMFFYSFIHDNVIVFSLEQFTLLQNSTSGFWITLASYIIKEILNIFAIFISIYIVWKTIVSSSDYVFRMIGLSDITNTSQFADDITNTYKNRYAFAH